MNKLNQKYIGSNFDNFLNEIGILEEVTAVAHKRILAEQIKQIMEQKHITKTEMAEKMETSRSAVNRLLNPNNPNVTLDTLDRAAIALGMKLNISLN
ncbi:helix-turn-helix domain-containing protein [Rickettsia bellii]|uniref:HTH cro/C1-type domain-containing protein n=1 Tax=Rickettsia bellii (strain RML369-C) TaxID=336407 RepID=Q1RIL4_RICBR|nr:helix-turn-helix transcriptional regulator [Rickettsia bellii]ABE04800.1 unknown [Rickettsia bellii RML369-C]